MRCSFCDMFGFRDETDIINHLTLDHRDNISLYQLFREIASLWIQSDIKKELEK